MRPFINYVNEYAVSMFAIFGELGDHSLSRDADSANQDVALLLNIHDMR